MKPLGDNQKRIFLNEKDKDKNNFYVRFIDKRTNQLVTISNFSEIKGRGIIKAVIKVGENSPKHITMGALKDKEQEQKDYLKKTLHTIFENGRLDDLQEGIYNHIGDFKIIQKTEIEKRGIVSRPKPKKHYYLTLGEPKIDNMHYVREFLDPELKEERKRLQDEKELSRYIQESRRKMQARLPDKSRKQFAESVQVNISESTQIPRIEDSNNKEENWRDNSLEGFKGSLSVSKIIEEVQRQREERKQKPTFDQVATDTYLNELKQPITWTDYRGTDLTTGKVIELRNCIESKINNKYVYTGYLNRTDMPKNRELGYMTIFELPCNIDKMIRENNINPILQLLSEDEKAPRLSSETMTFLGTITEEMNLQRAMPSSIVIRNRINQSIKAYEEIMKGKRSNSRTK